MAGPKLFDRVKDTSTTTGTGALTLANSAPTGFRTFGSVLSDADTCFYAIATSGSAEWEVGIGTYTASGTTLARTTILASSNSNNAVNLSSGTKDVFIPTPAAVQNHLYNPTGTYSSLAAYMAGRVLFPSDDTAIQRDTGSVLVPWGPVWKIGNPNLQTWSWVNQGSASVVANGSSLYLNAPSNGSANGARMRVHTAPATPYTFTAKLGLVVDWSDNGYASAAVGFRQSSDGKMVLCELWSQTANGSGTAGSSFILKIVKWTDASNISSTPLTAYWYGYGDGVWLRIADNGTNRIISVSPDGLNFIAINTEGRTTFLTADQVGFGGNPYSQEIGVGLLSWLQG